MEGCVFFEALAIIFLAWGLFTHTFGLIIPGSVLGGIGISIFLTGLPVSEASKMVSDGVFLIGFASGWALISLLSLVNSDNFVWWPLIPGGILATIGAMLMTGLAGLSLLAAISYAWLLALVEAGIYILVRQS